MTEFDGTEKYSELSSSSDFSGLSPLGDLNDHPVPYSIPGTKGLVAFIGNQHSHWRALRERLPTLWNALRALRNPAATYWVVAVIDMPPSSPSSLAIKPHYDICLTPNGLDHLLQPLETDILYPGVPGDLRGGELVVLSDRAAEAWKGISERQSHSARDHLARLGARFLRPKAGEGFALHGAVCHAVMGYSSDCGRRQSLVVGQFIRHEPLARPVFLG